MASNGKIQREIALGSRVSSVKNKRSALKAKILELEILKKNTSDPNLILGYTKETFAIMKALQKDRGSSYVRLRNRCQITGRTRGYLRMFGMCRGMVRHFASFGLLNGVKKSSHS